MQLFTQIFNNFLQFLKLWTLDIVSFSLQLSDVLLDIVKVGLHTGRHLLVDLGHLDHLRLDGTSVLLRDLFVVLVQDF